MRPRRTLSALVPLVLAVVLAACSDDGGPAPTTAPPVSAAPPTEIPQTEPTPATPSVTTPPPATTTATTEPPPATTTEPQPLRISVDVYDGIAEGEPRVVVARGDEIELIVTADVPDEMHVHGYDLKADVFPDSAAVITFVADLPGIYEVELEESGLVLFELEVR